MEKHTKQGYTKPLTDKKSHVLGLPRASFLRKNAKKSAKLKRKDINGFSFNALGYTFEVVTIKHLPRSFSISKPIYKTLRRWEF
jgi:hypothetical protein